MKLNPKYVQLFSDALIPLIGLFLWNWSLYFILLFYFLDLISAEIIVHLKSKKTVAFQSMNRLKKEWLKLGATSFLFLVLAIIVIHFAVYFISPGINFKIEALAFWNYEEMGIQQGYLLLPLVFFVSYQQYKMTFLMAGRFRNAHLISLWKRHITPLLLITAFAGICLGISWFVNIPETIYVLGIIALSTLYKLRYNEV
ncbi:MAG: hypothetical protein QNL61_05880 [Crocinitomicaceae bacterium]